MKRLASLRSLPKRVHIVQGQCRRYSASAESGSDFTKPYYITTPIFYPNAVPHIGHLHTLVVADIYARHAKLCNPNRPVRFITGTDEHGLKLQKAAEAKGMAPLDFCDELSVHFRNLTKKANISSTRFTRTTEKQHCDAVSHLWTELDNRGLIYKGRHAGWYSVSDETFYPASQVALQEKDGVKYHISTTSGSRVEWQQEVNYKFRLSAFEHHLHDYYVKRPDVIQPAQFHADVMNMLDEPLEDLSISRKRSRLHWGIPVPKDPEHTIYVWIDALTVYLSSVGYPWPTGKGLADGWPPDVQVIGKDILRFHALYLPAMLMALSLPLSKQLLVHSHWTVEKAKMSKSVGNVADPVKAIDEYGIDLVRYYLARVGGRFKDDVDWSQEQLQKHCREIISLLGNLFLRATSRKIMKRVASVPRPSVSLLSGTGTSSLAPLLSSLKALAPSYEQNMQRFQVADAVEAIVLALQEANLLMTRAAPWSNDTSPAVAADVQALIFETLRQCGILLQPFMPETAALLLDSLGVPPDQRSLVDAAFGKAGLGDVRPGVRLFDIDMSKM
ncbi:tRNA synthetases class I (M)-domain-containing protein [Cubamyces lactineus]|nr:tRNA synthetases class I (M)-domain-containing protein [Cubamyces lactineus]